MVAFTRKEDCASASQSETEISRFKKSKFATMICVFRWKDGTEKALPISVSPVGGRPFVPFKDFSKHDFRDADWGNDDLRPRKKWENSLVLFYSDAYFLTLPQGHSTRIQKTTLSPQGGTSPLTKEVCKTVVHKASALSGRHGLSGLANSPRVHWTSIFGTARTYNFVIPCIH